MAAHFPVAPAGAGGATRNNLVLECSLVVVTDYRPEQVGDGGDVFTLTSAGGPKPCNVSVDIKDARERVGGYVALVFKDLAASARYTLKVKLKSGQTDTLFEDVPYHDLSGASDGLEARSVGPR